MNLGDFLRAQCGVPGPWNCSSLPGDWCVVRGHPDMFAPWRRYDSDEECAAIQNKAGGLLPLWEGAIGNRLPVVTEVMAGDIGILSILDNEIGGLFTGERWAVRKPRGIGLFPLDPEHVVKAWRP